MDCFQLQEINASSVYLKQKLPSILEKEKSQSTLSLPEDLS